MKLYKKIDYHKCKEEGLDLKTYFKNLSISDSRMFYCFKYFPVPTIRLNYKQDKREVALSRLHVHTETAIIIHNRKIIIYIT